MNPPGPLKLKPPASRLTSEIMSMMTLFGCPGGSSMEPTAKAMESYIRTALTALIARAKAVSQRRGASSKPTPEDFLFCLKESPGMVARLADYLSWKEIRKKSNREHQEDVPSVDGIEEADIASIAAGDSLDRFKQQQLKIALTWDFNYTLADALAYFDDARHSFLGDAEWTERLKAMDELSKSMSREDYLAFSESRKATFTYGKGKRFKEFVGYVVKPVIHIVCSSTTLTHCGHSYQALVDVQPSDEIMDILSFVAYELVGYYTRIAKAAQDQEASRKSKSSKSTNEMSPSGKRSLSQQRPNSPAPARRLETPVGPFSMPLERPPEKGKGGGKDGHPVTVDHLNSAIRSQGLGLGMITPKSNGYGFGNFGGPGKKRRLM